jgi:hypothetical protein
MEPNDATSAPQQSMDRDRDECQGKKRERHGRKHRNADDDAARREVDEP